MERVILHSDLNNFFASVETVLHPEYKGKPLVVCGDPKKRLGVVFAKNYEAKAFGVQTAETVVSALKKCPKLILCAPHFSEYNRFSAQVRKIYERYTDQIEALSIDECAMDLTASVRLFGSGKEIADKIREEVKRETGLTVSIGVSFNKSLAKLASEMKKPDATTVLLRADFKEKIYGLPASDLLFIGGKSAEILKRHGILTIGDVAKAGKDTLCALFGKRGAVMHAYASGEDDEPVRACEDATDMKSIGNSMTFPKDVSSRERIKRAFLALSESVCARMRDANVGKCDTVHIWVKNEKLQESVKQRKIPPTDLCKEVAKYAYELFLSAHAEPFFVHALGLTVSGFDFHIEQLRLDDDGKKEYEKHKREEDAVAKIREKYGFEKIQRGSLFGDDMLSGVDVKHRKD